MSDEKDVSTLPISLGLAQHSAAEAAYLDAPPWQCYVDTVRVSAHCQFSEAYKLTSRAFIS